MRVRAFAIVTCVAALASGVVAWSAAGLAGNTWAFNFGDPGRDGVAGIEIKFKYLNPLGAQQTKVVQASVPLTASMDENQKRVAIQAAINTALAANGVNGNGDGTSTPLGQTSGLGDVMNVGPTGNNADFTDCKIEDIDIEDRVTGEKDKVMKPYLPGGPGGLGQISAGGGDISGFTPDGTPSYFVAVTDRGEIEVTLYPGMSKLELLEEIHAGLLRQGVRAWVDSDLLILFVWIADDEKEGTTGIGSGCTDASATARTKVIAG